MPVSFDDLIPTASPDRSAPPQAAPSFDDLIPPPAANPEDVATGAALALFGSPVRASQRDALAADPLQRDVQAITAATSPAALQATDVSALPLKNAFGLPDFVPIADPTTTLPAFGAGALESGAGLLSGAAAGRLLPIAATAAGVESAPLLGVLGLLGSVGGFVAGSKGAEQGIEHFSPEMAAAAQQDPTARTAGALTVGLLPAPGAIDNLTRAGEMVAAQSGNAAAAKFIARELAQGAALGAGADTTVRALSGDPITPGTVATGAGLGAMLAGGNLKFRDIATPEVQQILAKGIRFKQAADAAGPDGVVPSDIPPLTTGEQQIFDQATQQLAAQRAALPEGATVRPEDVRITGEQVTGAGTTATRLETAVPVERPAITVGFEDLIPPENSPAPASSPSASPSPSSSPSTEPLALRTQPAPTEAAVATAPESAPPSAPASLALTPEEQNHLATTFGFARGLTDYADRLDLEALSAQPIGRSREVALQNAEARAAARKQIVDLAPLGYTPEEAAAMPARKAFLILKDGIRSPNAPAESAPSASPSPSSSASVESAAPGRISASGTSVPRQPSIAPDPQFQASDSERKRIVASWKGSPTMEDAKPGDDYNGWVESKQEILHTITLPEGWKREEESYHTKWGSAYLYLRNQETEETIKVRIGDHPASRDRAAENDLSYQLPKNATLADWAQIASKVEADLADFGPENATAAPGEESGGAGFKPKSETAAGEPGAPTRAEDVRLADRATEATSVPAQGASIGSASGVNPNPRISASGTAAPRVNAATPSGPSAPSPNRIPPQPPTPPSPQPVTPAAQPPAPPVGPIRQWFAERALGFHRIFAPHAIDSGAAEVAHLMRELLGERANNLIRSEHAMSAWRQEFDRTPVPRSWTYTAGQPLPHNYAVIDAFEQNRAALPTRLQQLAQVFDSEFAWRIATIRQFAPQALSKLITDYFPHIWTDPKRAEGVMAQVATRRFAGRKEFLKERTLPIFAEGLQRGLVPISDNPVDLLLAKMHSMDKFIVALKAQAEFKAIGHMKFKYALEETPEGWETIDDPAFIIFAPPTVTVKEAFDAQLRTRTLELLAKLGVPNSRLNTLGGKRWGMAYESPEQIKTRFAGPESVYWHELGHVLEYRYDLKKAFIDQGKAFDAELRALADKRLPEGDPGYTLKPKVGPRGLRQVKVPTSFRNYVRNADEKMAVMLEAYVHAPDLFKATAPTVYAKFDKFIDAHPELHDIRRLKPSLRLGTGETEIPLNGVLKLGEWIMPSGPAQVIKNYLSPGLAHSGVYRTLRAASNLLNAAQLGLSAFHVGFTSLDAVVNAVEVGLYRAIHGKVLEGAGHLLGAPLAPVANYYSGKAIQAAMLDPHATDITVGPDLFGMKIKISQAAHDFGDLAVKAGLRASVDPFWKTEVTRKLTRAIHAAGQAWQMGRKGDAAAAAGEAIMRAPFALIENLMRPIAEYLVPRQKLGVFALLAKAELEQLPTGASPEEVRAALARAADATEDRMGQMTYDNLFYNRVAKDLSLLAFRAYGWQLGKYRHLAGAISDTAGNVRQAMRGELPKPTNRQLYFLSLVLTVGAIGAVLHYLRTGKPPESLVDYLHPATGEIDLNGNPKRLSLPSYLKDIESDGIGVAHGWRAGGPIGVAKGVWDATYHRLNPGVSEVIDILNNRDFYGTQIAAPDDPVFDKMRDQAAFIAKGFVPFSVTGAMKLSEGEHKPTDYLLPFFGIVPAKQELIMTPAQAKAAEAMRDSASLGGRTRDQAQRAQELKADLDAWRRKNPLPNPLANPREAAAFRKRASLQPFQYQVSKLPFDQALRVWDLANSNERTVLAPILIQKAVAAGKAGQPVPKSLSRDLMESMTHAGSQ